MMTTQMAVLNRFNSSFGSPIILRLVPTSRSDIRTGTNETETKIAEAVANSIVDDLNLIKSKLGLSKVELAKVSKIPRATLYKVLSYELPAEERHQRVRDLASIIKSTFEGGIKNRVALKNFYVEGKNLIQLLSEEKLNSGLIESLAAQISSEIDKRTKSVNGKIERVKPDNTIDPEFDSTWISSES